MAACRKEVDMKAGLIGIVAVSIVLTIPFTALAEAQDRVPIADLETALHDLDSDYGDVPSAVNCDSQADAGTAVALICSDPYLRTAELLNTRAAAYMYENGTKSEVDHKAWRGEIPTECKTGDCIYGAFRAQTDDALGGESPYYKFYSTHK
jgi:hypothetical protein